MNDVEPREYTELLRWIGENRARVPNLGRLYSKMVNEPTFAHYIHARCVRKLHECGRYRITDIVAPTGGHDVDIRLDGRINIQVLYAVSTYGRTMEEQLRSGSPKSDAAGRCPGITIKAGGVQTNFDHDGEQILKKLAQLPGDALGILLLHSNCFGYWIMFHSEEIPANKCILNINSLGTATELHCSLAFSHHEEIDSIARCLGLDV